jgi:exosortase/archaeosortase family protein
MLTLPIAIVMNGFRIAATGIACETWGPHVASGGWHTFTGWVTFVVSTFLLIQAGRALAWFDREPPLPREAITV